MVVRGRVGRAAGLLLTGVLAVAGPGTGTAVSASVARADVVSWSAVSHLTPGVDGIYATDVVAHPDGSVTAMWIGPTWERRRVHVRHRPADGDWQAAEVVTGTRDAYEARLGADGRGNLVLAWAANRRVMLARRAPGAAWSPAQVLHRTPGGERGTRPVGLALAVDERGHAALAWEERDDDLDALYVPPRVQMTAGARSGDPSGRPPARAGTRTWR